MHLSPPERYAVIDVGTHSVLMLVCDVSPYVQGCQVVLDIKEITRLGQGLVEANELRTDAMERTCAVIEGYVTLAQHLGVQQVLAVGTSALRQAVNACDFLRCVRDCCNLHVEMLSGEAEARCSYLAIRDNPDLSSKDISQLMVVDVGGGSTEIVSGGQNIMSSVSVNAGAVYLTESFLGHDPPTGEELGELAVFLQHTWENQAVFAKPTCGSTALVGLGGTIVNLASVKLGLSRFDSERLQGSVLGRAEIAAQIDVFCSATLGTRKQLRGLEEERADVIIAGASILHSFLCYVGASEIQVSTHGLRYGVMYQRFCARTSDPCGLVHEAASPVHES